MTQRWGTQRTATTEWRNLRLRILERDAYRCRICGPGCTAVADSVDHVVPVYRGGSDHESNLVSACAACHRNKTGHEGQAALAAKKRRPMEAHPGYVDG